VNQFSEEGPWKPEVRELSSAELDEVKEQMGCFTHAFTVRRQWNAQQIGGMRCIEVRSTEYAVMTGKWVGNIRSSTIPDKNKWGDDAIRARLESVHPDLGHLVDLKGSHLHSLHFVSGTSSSRDDPRVAAADADWGVHGDLHEDVVKWTKVHMFSRTLFVYPGVPVQGNVGLRRLDNFRDELAAPRRVFEVSLKRGKVM